MTELELYKFINENCIEYHWHENNVFMFIPIYIIEEFATLFSESFFDESELKCTFRNDYFCFEMQDICDFYGMDMKKVFNEGR